MSALLTKPRQDRRAASASWSDRSIAEQFGLWPPQPRIAVLIPCRNEAFAIGTVVTEFRRQLPDAAIYVYDNNSSDQTVRAAEAAGAIVRCERLQGKGHVIRRMFADVEADVYILVDGDDTYDAAAAPMMLNLLIQRQLDMVSAARHDTDRHAYRFGHRLGNRLLTRIVTRVFGHGITDLLSGYRVFSRRFVKSFPALACGFETETEFTIHALALCMPMQEIRASYRGRSDGSRSKLNTLVDGTRILRTILSLIQHERPLQLYSFTGLASLLTGIIFGVPVITEFLHTGLVPRLPTALLAASLVLLGFLFLSCGLVLDAVARGRKEVRRLAYLAIPPLDIVE